MKKIPECPAQLPANIGDLVRKLGTLWAVSDVCPKIEKKTKDGWNRLLKELLDDKPLPF